MGDPVQLPSVLVISGDSEIVEAIIGNNNSTDQVFHARESVQLALGEPSLFDNNGVIIFDIATTGNDVEKSIDQAIKLKQADPTQVLMIVGDKEPLSDILKSSIQPMVYRAFNKPIGPNQISLAFKSAHTLHQDLVKRQASGEDISYVGPQENKTSLDALAEERKSNPMVYGAIAVAALAIIGFLIFAGGNEAPAPVVVEPTIESNPLDDSDTISRTNTLNQLAENAMLDGRYVSPAGDNALEYYDKVLLIDPYDSTAYEGKKSVAMALRDSYDKMVANARFDKALDTINALKSIEPLNLEHDKLKDKLEKAIAAHVKKIKETGTAKDISKTSAVLAKIESEFAGSKSASEALKAEQVLIGKIDAALNANNLIPPQKGNAYSLVSDALKGNKISKANANPRVKTLSAKLLRMANASLTEDNLEETTKLGALVKRLNVDRNGLNALDKKLKARVAQITAAKTEKTSIAPVKKETKSDPAKIIPAKIISRTPPRYPGRARKKGVEGWVDITFKINTSGVPFDVKVKQAQPAGVFETAAIKSVKKWRFSPARNQQTGLPVESTAIATKVQFKLN